MNYIELQIKIKPFKEEYAEIVEAMLCELPFESFTIQDSRLNCYISQENFNMQKVKVILDFFTNHPDFSVSESHNLIMEQNWNSEWEKNFTPIILGNKVVVKAPFHKNISRAKYNIRIEPRMAFGTGHHQTTLLMMSSILLLAGDGISKALSGISVKFFNNFLLPCKKLSGKRKNLIKNKKVLDMGTGTGILAFLCAKLGAKRQVDAIDIDATAVNSALTNAWINRLHNAVNIRCGDSSLICYDSYNYILANINRNILLDDMSVYAKALHNDGILILSGFYKNDIPLLVKEAEKYNMRLVFEAILDDWAAIMLKKLF